MYERTAPLQFLNKVLHGIDFKARILHSQQPNQIKIFTQFFTIVPIDNYHTLYVDFARLGKMHMRVGPTNDQYFIANILYLSSSSGVIILRYPPLIIFPLWLIPASMLWAN